MFFIIVSGPCERKADLRCPSAGSPRRGTLLTLLGHLHVLGTERIWQHMVLAALAEKATVRNVG